jgi:hypothetical protein
MSVRVIATLDDSENIDEYVSQLDNEFNTAWAEQVEIVAYEVTDSK